jgi:hypothetical protein
VNTKIDPFKTYSFEFRSFSLSKLLAEVPVSEGAAIYHSPPYRGLGVTFARNGDIRCRLLVPTMNEVMVFAPNLSGVQTPFTEILRHVRADDQRLDRQLLDAIQTYFTPESIAHVPICEYILHVQRPALAKLVESLRSELP